MGTFYQDLRFALRQLGRNPGFAAVAILTLALGIGANSAIFSVVNAVLLRPLPYSRPDRLVMISGSDGAEKFGVSERERERYRGETGIFEGVAAYYEDWMSLTGAGEAERLRGGAVEADLLPLLGGRLGIGRTFAAQEDVPGGPQVAIISDGLWRRRFGSDPGILGKTVQLDGVAHAIIGVLAPDFRLPTDFGQLRSDVLVPLAPPANPDPRNFHYLTAVGALRAGVDLEAARSQLVAVSAGLRAEIATLPKGFSATIVTVRERIVGGVRPLLLLLASAVGFILLIGCANIANLVLARSEVRQREIAIRAALGAGSGRLARLLLTESLVLALAGGVSGLFLADLSVRALGAFNPPDLPRLDEVTLDRWVLGVTLLLSLLTGAGFGLVPALRVARRGSAAIVREGRQGGSVARRGSRRALVTAEIALAVMLSIGAGLMVRSFRHLLDVRAGFDPAGVLTMQLSLPDVKYPASSDARRFYATLIDQVRALPGVAKVGAVSRLPLANEAGDWGIRIRGREDEVTPAGRRPYADWVVVTEDYFSAMGIPLREGRFLEASDGSDAPGAVIINQTMARRYWPGRSAVGEQFRLSSDIDTLYRTVVGVVGDVRHDGLDAELHAQMFLPHRQFPATATFPVSTMALVVRTAGDAGALAAPVIRTVQALDPDVALSRVETMGQVVAASTAARRLTAILFAAFGFLSLTLVAVGVYGVMAYLVTQRTRELGIRLALGATRGGVLRLVLKEGLALAGVGVTTGVLGALALAPLLSTLVFGVGTRDAMTFALTPVVLVGVTLLACYLPGRRAARVDPMVALRAE